MNDWLISHRQLLSRQYHDDTLPHAIIFNAVTGAGKYELAQWLVRLVNCSEPQTIENAGVHYLVGCEQCKSCLLLNSNTYPDFLSLVAEKNSLGVDDIRRANTFLQKTAHLGKYKIVLIEQAQIMTHAAANALLKTLEEPSENSIIVLLTNDIDRLLPTIVSRCRVLNIRPNVGQALLQSLSEQSYSLDTNSLETSTPENQHYINLTQLPELTDPSTNQAFHDVKQCYINVLKGEKAEATLLQQLLDNEHALRWLEQITVNLLRERHLNAANLDERYTISTTLLNALYCAIINANRMIKSYTQANQQFVCEQLIMVISEEVEQT